MTLLAVQFVAEAEDFAEAESQQGHDHKLRHAAGDHIAGLFEDHGEIGKFHRQAHAEHDDHQKIVDPLGLYPEAGARQEEREGGYDQDDPCHVFADKFTDFVHLGVPPCVMGTVPLTTFVEKLSGLSLGTVLLTTFAKRCQENRPCDNPSESSFIFQISSRIPAVIRSVAHRLPSNPYT